MTNLESLEKLREAASNSQVELPEISWSWGLSVGECKWLNQVADEIQAEIDERFMELPVDADGVPWTESDTEFIGKDGYKRHLDEITYNLKTHKWSLLGSHGLYKCDANHCRHVKPDPVKELLRDYCVDIAHQLEADPDKTISESTIANYAERIRQAVES